MKALLIIALITFTFCQDEPKMTGGWTRHSVEENDLYIDRSFKEAGLDYIKSSNVEQDDLIRLTVYTQVVSGTNYKITFLDTKAEFPSIQEYVFYRSLSNDRKENNFKLSDHKEYQADNGLIPFNDPNFELLENTLYKLLKQTKEELKYVSYVYPIENRETNFFLITGYTADGEHKYVLCQDKSSKDFYSFNKVK